MKGILFPSGGTTPLMTLLLYGIVAIVTARTQGLVQQELTALKKCTSSASEPSRVYFLMQICKKINDVRHKLHFFVFLRINSIQVMKL